MTAGYSGTPQARKLGFKSGQRVFIESAPAGWEPTDPPDGLVFVGDQEPADLVLAFFRSAAELDARLPDLARRIYPAGALWIAWPRKAAGHVTDLSDGSVRASVLELGLVDTKIAAIDDDWSGQKAVWRVSNRTTERAPL